MPWQGDWNNGVFRGTYTADDGTVFEGTWTPSEGQDPPDGSVLISSDPFFLGAPLHNREWGEQTGPWQGSYGADGAWHGSYTAADGTVFRGTMATKPPA
jgi:hypothetical protein